MSNLIVIDSLTLTNEPIEESDDPAIRYKIQKAYDKLHQERPAAHFGEWLQTQIIQYPEIPQFHNYLAAYYQKIGEKKRHQQAVEEMFRIFPDYLFGKIMKSRAALAENDLEAVEALMGEEMDLAKLYPDRSVFHETEFINFQLITVTYFIKKGNLDEAERRLDQMKRVDESHSAVFMLELKIATARMAEVKDFYQNEDQSLTGSYDKEVQTDTAPTFHHAEIQQLYTYNLTIDQGILRNILSLPRKTLIQDLEAVVKDSVYRHEFFQNKKSNEEQNFHFHALYLLTELESEESLETVLYVLGQGQHFLDLWFDDFLLEEYWRFLYKMGQNQLSMLKDFFLERNNFTYARAVILTMLSQLGLHQPERLAEITAWIKEAGNYFLEHQEDASLIDHFVVADLILVITDLDLQGLDEMVEALFEADIVDLSVMGDWESYLEEKGNKAYQYDKRYPLRNIYDQYDHITSTWHGYKNPEEHGIDEIDDAFGDFDEFPQNEGIWDETVPLKPRVSAMADSYQRNSPKIGRNEPCPCGSGKKYKKCCMKR